MISYLYNTDFTEFRLQQGYNRTLSIVFIFQTD